MNNENYLAHYGVLGMKWGMRKAEKSGTTYTYKSHGQKKWEKRVNSLTGQKNKTAKLKKAKKKLAVYKQRDKNRQNYAKTTSVGAQIARDVLMTPLYSGMYTRARASGKSIIQSFLSSYTVWDSKMSEMGTARAMVDPKSGSLYFYKKKSKRK